MNNIDLYNLFPIVYHHLLFILVLFACVSIINRYKSLSRYDIYKAFGLSLIVIMLIGFLPIPWLYGGDRYNYTMYFNSFKTGEILEFKKDFIFYKIMHFFSLFSNYTVFYLFIAFFYVYSRYYFARKETPYNTYLMLLAFFSSFSFYAYGTNTIRAGFAVSIILIAITNFKKNFLFYALLLLGFFIHGSVIITIIAFLIAKFYNKPRMYFKIWFISIAVSFASGQYFEQLFVGLIDESRSSYLLSDISETAYKIGFRWDFLFYSLFPVLIGWYYIFKLKFNNKFYSILYSTYLISNSFWILIIRSNYSDRFAYLSWFLYPIILIYPALVVRLWKNQNIKIALILFINALFTYIMFLKG